MDPPAFYFHQLGGARRCGQARALRLTMSNEMSAALTCLNLRTHPTWQSEKLTLIARVTALGSASHFLFPPTAGRMSLGVRECGCTGGSGRGR
jgi:hypothetical protein